jgi:hypothetical protein
MPPAGQGEPVARLCAGPDMHWPRHRLKGPWALRVRTCGTTDTRGNQPGQPSPRVSHARTLTNTCLGSDVRLLGGTRREHQMTPQMGMEPGVGEGRRYGEHRERYSGSAD